jgi:hypothetical protein
MVGNKMRQYFIRVHILEVGFHPVKSKPVAVFKKKVASNSLGKWTLYKWAELLEGTEWETIPKDKLPLSKTYTPVSDGWKWEALVCGINSAAPTVWSPDGGRCTGLIRRPIRKRTNVEQVRH